jgi:ATP-dependent Clp protease ATP-binding subunit ClpA
VPEANGKTPQVAEPEGFESRLPARLFDQVDRVVQFGTLMIDDLEAIAKKKMRELAALQKELKGITLEVSPAVAMYIAMKAAGGDSTARAVRQAARDCVDMPLGAYINELHLSRSARVCVSVVDDQILFSVAAAEA